MLTIAVIQQKGGVGKTTLAINLAAAAHLEGKRTLVVDMDRQGSAFDWSMARQAGSKLEGLATVRADRALPLARFRDISRDCDCVFLDGPPRLGDITKSAAICADVCLLPTQAGAFDFWALPETVETLGLADQLRGELGLAPVLRLFVINRAPVRSRIAREAAIELEAACTAAPEQGGGLFVGTVHQRVAFADCAIRGESVFTTNTPGGLLAAGEIQKLWRAIRKAASNESNTDPTPQRSRKRKVKGS